MRKLMIILILLGWVVAGCASSATSGEVSEGLTVGGDANQKVYSMDDLKNFPSAESVFNEVTYVGVPTTVLLKDAGIDTSNLKAIKAVASDGYTVNYEPELFLREDILVAYAQADGPLSEDDGMFRMVLPGEEGKINIRFLVEIVAIH